jgi:hypothetical protein
MINETLRKIARNTKLRRTHPHLSNELLKIAEDFQDAMSASEPTLTTQPSASETTQPLVGETQYAGVEQKAQKPESSKHTVKFDVNVPVGADVDDLLITGTLYNELKQLISSKGLELSGFSFTKTGG